MQSYDTLFSFCEERIRDFNEYVQASCKIHDEYILTFCVEAMVACWKEPMPFPRQYTSLPIFQREVQLIDDHLDFSNTTIIRHVQGLTEHQFITLTTILRMIPDWIDDDLLTYSQLPDLRTLLLSFPSYVLLM